VADLRLLCTDLRAEAAAARAEAAEARAEAQRQQSEFNRVVKERDQSRGRAAEAESRAETLAADLAVAQVAASEQRARAGGTPWPSSAFVPACFLCLCLRSFFWLFAELESALDESAKALVEALAGAAEQRETNHAAMSEAVSDVYRVLGSGDVPSGSSPQSRLQVLGDHVRGRLREALHHGVRGWMRPPRVRAQCWRPPLRQRSSHLRHRRKPGWTLPKVGTKPKSRLLPEATPNSVGTVSVGCTCVLLRPLRPKHLVTVA
jgi:hypothetical protein